jgi:putative inorganic carbon (hco3(-)) transporter
MFSSNVEASSAATPIPSLLSKIIFFALLALIALVAVPYGTVEPWWQALFECAVFGLVALCLIEGFLTGSYGFASYRIFLPLVALAIFGLLQTAPIGGDSNVSFSSGVKVWRTLSADPHGTRLWVSRMLALILVGAMLLRYTSSQRRLKMLVYLVIGVAVASAVFGLVRKMTQHEVGFFLPYLSPGFGYAQFINNNHFAFLMEMALGLVLGLAVGGSVPRERLPVYFGAVLLLAMSIVVSKSRGGILSMLCQIVFVALFVSIVRPVRDRTAWRGGAISFLHQVTSQLIVRALLVAGLVVIVGVGIVWVGGDPLLGRLETLPKEVSEQSERPHWGDRRVEIWRATWQVIKAHPIAGVGMGGYWAAIPQYHDGSGEMTPQRAHNDYLELLASGGLIGFALGVWFVIVLIREASAQARSADRFRRAAIFGALCGLFGVAVHSFVDFGLHITANAVVAITLVVIATADIPRNEPPDSPRKPF